MSNSKNSILIYLLRRDLRISDNPIFHRLSTTHNHGFTHFLPIFVFPAHQLEVSGFLKPGSKSPYPEARSRVGRYWRCGPHRAKFLAQSVWELKEGLRAIGSDLSLHLGRYEDVLEAAIQYLKKSGQRVGGVWTVKEETYEEVQDEQSVAAVCKRHGIEFTLWADEKYFIDDRDIQGIKIPQGVPNVFSTYLESQGSLLSRPRMPLVAPDASTLPPFPEAVNIPPQGPPFVRPTTYAELEKRLLAPLTDMISNPPVFPGDASSSHPFTGGELHAHDRLRHVIVSGAIATYGDTRNGLLELDCSTKLGAYLSLGCITARQINADLVRYETGKLEAFAEAPGFACGENKGTLAMRIELMWRDYFRLTTMKYGLRIFQLTGLRPKDSDDEGYSAWWTPIEEKAVADQEPKPKEVARIIERFLSGTTGHGLIDASMRELYHTGYTSNRARQNTASFFAKHLRIDWRYGAEWYESMLVDYDASSNWNNWQYLAGVGNDPRGESRWFHPVKQAFEYDPDGEYVKSWMPEVRKIESLEHIFQPCTVPVEKHQELGLSGLALVDAPLKKMSYWVKARPRRGPSSRPRGTGRGTGRGGSSVQGPTEGHNDSPPPEQQDGTNESVEGSTYPARAGPRGNRRAWRGRSAGRGGRGFPPAAVVPGWPDTRNDSQGTQKAPAIAYGQTSRSYDTNVSQYGAGGVHYGGMVNEFVPVAPGLVPIGYQMAPPTQQPSVIQPQQVMMQQAMLMQQASAMQQQVLMQQQALMAQQAIVQQQAMAQQQVVIQAGTTGQDGTIPSPGAPRQQSIPPYGWQPMGQGPQPPPPN